MDGEQLSEACRGRENGGARVHRVLVTLELIVDANGRSVLTARAHVASVVDVRALTETRLDYGGLRCRATGNEEVGSTRS